MLTDINLVTIGIILVIVYFFVLGDIYINSMYDANGIMLNFQDTFKNIFGIYNNISLPSEETIIDTISAEKEIDMNPINIESEVTNSELLPPLPEENVIQEIPKEEIPVLPKEKEVFNIDNNVFTYEDAQHVCKAYGAELATPKQLKIAHMKGANWCNYGWSADQHALFPIQKEYYDYIQKTSLKDSCGKPGVNGSKFNADLKFGVNCYGYKPDPDESKITYMLPEEETSEYDTFLKTFNKDNYEIRPFNKIKWSRYSERKSSYNLDSDLYDSIETNYLKDKAADVTPEEVELNKIYVNKKKQKDRSAKISDAILDLMDDDEQNDESSKLAKQGLNFDINEGIVGEEGYPNIYLPNSTSSTTTTNLSKKIRKKKKEKNITENFIVPVPLPEEEFAMLPRVFFPPPITTSSSSSSSSSSTSTTTTTSDVSTSSTTTTSTSVKQQAVLNKYEVRFSAQDEMVKISNAAQDLKTWSEENLDIGNAPINPVQNFFGGKCYLFGETSGDNMEFVISQGYIDSDSKSLFLYPNDYASYDFPKHSISTRPSGNYQVILEST